MTLFVKRKVSQGGGSYHIVLPSEWAKKNHIKASTELRIVADEFVVIIPPRDYTSLDFDKHFERLLGITKVVMSE